MVASREEIESLISKAKQDNNLKIAIEEVEKQTFKVGLYEFLLDVIRIYATYSYFWRKEIPTRKQIRAKLKKMIKATTKLLKEYQKPNEIIILENEYGKTDFFDSKRNFSLRQKELEQDLQLYNLLLNNIPSTGGGPNPQPSYKDIVQLLLPFLKKNKPNFRHTKKHGDTNVYLGDDLSFVMYVMPLLNKIDPSIELVQESTIGEYIITLYKAKNLTDP